MLLMDFFPRNSTIFFFFFAILSITMFPETSLASGENPLLHESSAREEMVKMAGYGEEKLSTVVVSGTVLCEACSNDDAPQQRHVWPVQGASIAIQCPTSRKRGSRSSRELVATTDGYGDFTMDLPSELHAIHNLESVCCVKVLRVPKHSRCKPAFVRKHKALTLTSSKDGIRIYSAGEINFWHSASKPSKACTKRGNNKGQAL